ncbi:MAG: peptidylprolyl isomerase [Hyphomonadaceae bacterium]|nr:peptidylprolyl isomerase [Hyphomonadaceae bacterium]
MVTAKPRRPHFILAGLALTLALSACGLGRDSSGDRGGIDNPTVAATVNGRPIYVEDVRSRAVQMGRLQEGEDLSADSDAFYLTLEELIQIRLFAMEAEARGLDREPDIRRQLENAREAVLAQAIYEELDSRATNPEAVERLYRENMRELDQGSEIHLRHIQVETREMADAAKRRLDSGERFEVLALSLSMDAETRADGGDLGFRAQSDLAPQIRQAVQNAHVGEVIGPLQIGDTWHLIRVDDIRQRGAPSLESLRPQIINWLRYQEVMELQDRLERDARIERLREPDTSMAPTEETPAPADAGEETPNVEPPPEEHQGGPAPPFPFPMGPGGVTAQQSPRPAPNTEGPAATAVGAPQQPAPTQPTPDAPVQ